MHAKATVGWVPTILALERERAGSLSHFLAQPVRKPKGKLMASEELHLLSSGLHTHLWADEYPPN